MCAIPSEPALQTDTIIFSGGAHPRLWTLAYSLYAVAANSAFNQAFWLIYLASRGYSPFAIGLFEMGFHVAKFVAEVPTGIFADLVGRRASLIAACIFGCVGELLLLTPATPLIILSFACSGVAFAFRGGAESALLWGLAERAGGGNDSNNSKQTERYSHLFSRMLVLGLIASAVGQTSGGFLAHVHVSLPFLCQAVFYALGSVPLLWLPEQRLTRIKRPQPLAHLRGGLRAVRRDPVLLGLLLLSGLEASIWTTSNFYTQLYFTSLGFTVAVVGVIFAASSVSDFLFTAATPRVMRHFSRRWLVPLLVAGDLLGLLAMSLHQQALALVGFLLLFHAADALFVPVVSTYLNERAPEQQRATVLSLETGLFSAAMIVLFPLFGLGLTRIAYSAAYLLACGVFAAGSLAIVALVWLMRRGSC